MLSDCVSESTSGAVTTRTYGGRDREERMKSPKDDGVPFYAKEGDNEKMKVKLNSTYDNYINASNINCYQTNITNNIFSIHNYST